MDLEIQASQLLDNALASYHSQYGTSSMTTTIYDTAWVSMISKEIDGNTEWLFPNSFLYLLDNQMPSGGWESYASDIDGILNTSAALLSLHKHHQTPYQLTKNILEGLPARLEKGRAFLETALQNWDFSATRHVGFEILVPCLLEMLESYGYRFVFDCAENLLKIREQKLAKLDPKAFYSDEKTSAIHSLEGYGGKIDFDRVGHHKAFGSMMGSPAATSAYLIYSSRWDVECEEYIRHVIEAGTGRGDGSVPSAFPAHLFEISWAVTSLIEGGFSFADLEPSLQAAKAILEEAFQVGSSIIGFAPLFEPDADDTAKGIIALSLLGKEISRDSLVQKFEQVEWFKTFRRERDPSFSANCNILRALASPTNGPQKYAAQIGKITRFICKSWLNNTNVARDKWNLSVEYSTMLAAQALVRIVNCWAEDTLPQLSIQFLREGVLLVLFQALFRTLRRQDEDGSWEGSPEVTAYAVLTINAVMSLQIFVPLRPQIDRAISSARIYLRGAISEHTSPCFIWVEKVTFSSSTVSTAYILAALKCSPTACSKTESMSRLFDGLLGDFSKQIQFFGRLPMFASTPHWCLQGSLIEGSFYSTPLKNKRNEIFGRQISGKAKHLLFIPFTWTGGNNMLGAQIGSDILLEMMVASAAAYDIDQIMESSVASLSADEWTSVKNAVRDICEDEKPQHTNGHPPRKSQCSLKRKRDSIDPDTISNTDRVVEGMEDRHTTNGASNAGQVLGSLRNFVEYYVKHSRVQSASSYDQAKLRIEIRDFLFAHLTQIKDNSSLKAQPNPETNGRKTFESMTGSFYSWIRSTSGNHTAGPFAFAFFLCLLGPGDGKDSLLSAEAKYVAEDVSRHLASLCRLYNDYGSVARDREEDNLNSIQFPEFTGIGGQTDQVLKGELFKIAEYERRCLEHSLVELQNLVSAEVFNAIKVFCSTADMYGQMYVLKDLTPGIKKSSGNAS